MTTLDPRTPYCAEELARLYPHDLELKQVQVLLRHGERTPVSTRFKNAGLPAYWPYCKAAEQLDSVVRNSDASWDTLTWRRRLETFSRQAADASSDSPIITAGPHGGADAVCQPGELTDRGRETTLALGQRIRKLYVDQLGFLPPTLDAKTLPSIYLRATPISRALESVQQTFVGLYPSATRAQGLPPPTVITRSGQDETLYPNESACKRFAELSHAFAQRTAELWNESPEMKYIDSKLGKWMPKESPVVKVDSHPRLSGIMDSINATLAHGHPTILPNEFYDKQIISNIDRICTEEWFVGYTESQEYRKLGIGGLVGDITQNMVRKACAPEESDFAIALSGCHDTTIGATIASLGAYDVRKDPWPPYTSSIVFELFKRKRAAAGTAAQVTTGTIWPSKERTWWYRLFSPSTLPSSQASVRAPLNEMSESQKSALGDYYVRLRYNDRPLTLPYCKQTGRHLENDESFCTLKAFKEAADEFTPIDWKAECKSNLGTPVFRPLVERPLSLD